MFGIGKQVNNLANPTAAGDPYWSSVVMLMRGNSSSASTYDDYTLGTRPISGSDVSSSSVQYKFGGASLLINNSDRPQDGTDSYIYAAPNSNFVMGTGNFTFDGWVYPLRTSGLNAIFDLRALGADVSPCFFIYNGAWASYANGWLFESAGTVSANTWYHYAYVRNGTTTTLYVNGSVVTSVSDSRNYICDAGPRIGAGWNSNDGFYGYLDDFRITKGVARYTSAFTPPTSEAPTS